MDIEDDDDFVTEVRYPELHAWLENYLADKSGVITVSTQKLHRLYKDWLTEHGLMNYDCKYQSFSARLRNFKDGGITIGRKYIKGVGFVATTVVDVSRAVNFIWAPNCCVKQSHVISEALDAAQSEPLPERGEEEQGS